MEKGRPEYPKQVRFVTYTLKYPACEWVTLLALGRHYEKASVDAEATEHGATVKTANVRLLTPRAGPQQVRQVPELPCLESKARTACANISNHRRRRQL